nr:hypothetical protein [Tanacetum cinerariifolium]
MLVRQAYTPIATDPEFEPFEDLIETKETQPLSPRVAPLSPDYTPASPYYIPDTSHSDEDSEPMERYRGTFEPILDTKTEGDESKAEGTSSKSEDLEEEGPVSESEEAAPEGQQQQAVPIEDTSADGPLGLGYGASRRRALELPTWVDPKDGTVYIDIEFDAPPVRAPVQTPTSHEWSSGSLLVSSASLTVPSPVASSVTTSAATITVIRVGRRHIRELVLVVKNFKGEASGVVLKVDEDEFLEVGAQLELHVSILHDHTHRLDALPPTLFEGYGRDFTRLFTRLETVRDEIHSQYFRLGSLKRRQEQATITFGAL